MKKPSIGGQAVLEGVMMRSPNYYATSVRNDKGNIVVQLKKVKKYPAFFKLPFVRGIVNLIDMMVIGIKSLTWSANQISDDEDEKLSNFQITLTLFVSIGFAILLFVALPYFLSTITGVKEEVSPILFNLIDGIIKIAVFIIYIYAISMIKDIKRVFEYHGAEHKTVYCYESGKPLTVKNVKKYSTKHPRCGTSFILIVLLISIAVFSLIPSIMTWIFPSFISLPFFLRKVMLFIIRILFLPLVASISYELLRFSGKHSKNKLVGIISYPGLLLQYITTKEPDNKQIEVAIKSMQLVINKEKIKL